MIWPNVQFQSEETIENLAQMSKVFLDKGKFVRRKTWELYPSQGTCGRSFATRKFDSLLANKKRKEIKTLALADGAYNRIYNFDMVHKLVTSSSFHIQISIFDVDNKLQ